MITNNDADKRLGVGLGLDYVIMMQSIVGYMEKADKVFGRHSHVHTIRLPILLSECNRSKEYCLAAIIHKLIKLRFFNCRF